MIDPKGKERAYDLVFAKTVRGDAANRVAMLVFWD